MGIEEMINEYKKQIENNMKYIEGEWACEADRISGMKIAVDVLRKIVKDLQLLKSSLPTQQDKVVVPELPRHIIDYLKWCERNNKTLLEVIGGARCHDADYAFWTEEERRKIAVAYATGDYTVEKEQLYIVKVGELAFVNWEDSMLAKMTTMDSPGWVNEANHFTTKVRANEIAKIIGGEAVPVMEDE